MLFWLQYVLFEIIYKNNFFFSYKILKYKIILKY